MTNVVETGAGALEKAAEAANATVHDAKAKAEDGATAAKAKAQELIQNAQEPRFAKQFPVSARSVAGTWPI